MKKIININLAGRLIPIEDTAYELLKRYLDSLNLYFGREEGGEEIVSDIEDRIAELFQEKLKKGAHCMTDQDVDLMIATMGRPEQLEEETSTEPQAKPSAQQERQQEAAGDRPKRLSRNENDKLIGGVCSGIANYFGIDPAIVRVITFIMVWAYGLGIMAYIVLWIILPGTNGNPDRLRRRLYRNTDSKVIGGVCSGIAAYFRTDTVIPRIIFILPLLAVIFSGIFSNIFDHMWFFNGLFFPFSMGAFPTLIVLYIVLWVAVPKAVTQAEKLEMRGEKVDLQSLSNAYKSSGNEEKKKMSPEPEGKATPSAWPEERKKYSGVGRVFVILVKVVLYFILGVVVLSLGAALLGIAGGFLGVTAATSMAFPFKAFLLSSPLQHTLLWPAILLTLGVPVIALIWFLVRVFTGFKPRIRYVGATLFGLWVIGVICTISLLVSIAKDFRMHYSRSETVAITQPDHNLVLRRQQANASVGNSWSPSFFFDDDEDDWLNNFVRISEDSLSIGAVELSVTQSTDSNFHVEIVRFSNGRSGRQAETNANRMGYQIEQQDSVLYIPRRFALPKGVPFRNQHIMLRIAVPEGKQLNISDSLKELQHHRFNRRGWEWDDSDWEHWEDRMDRIGA